jgi:hypothetical protein
MALNREALLAAASDKKNRARETLTIDGFGVVIVQGMSGTERDAWERSLIVGRGRKRDVNTENVRAKLAVRCIVNDAGEREMTDADAEAFGQLRVDWLNPIYEASQRVCGVSDEDVAELKKRSETAAGTDSPSA